MFSGSHSFHPQLFLTDCETSGDYPQYLLINLFSEGILKFITRSSFFLSKVLLEPEFLVPLPIWIVCWKALAINRLLRHRLITIKVASNLSSKIWIIVLRNYLVRQKIHWVIKTRSNRGYTNHTTWDWMINDIRQMLCGWRKW